MIITLEITDTLELTEPPKGKQVIGKALALAVKAHDGVKRKYGDEPYSNHVIRVAFEVARLGESEELVAAALLHDVLEDTDVPAEVIEQTCGATVLKIVQELTNPSHLPENKSKPRWQRKQIDRDHLTTVSREAKIIKLIDRIDNLQDVAKGPPDFQRLYGKESLALLDALYGAHPRLEGELRRLAQQLAL